MNWHGFNANDMAAQANRRLNTVDAKDESFDDYVATTIDPGHSLFLIALLICITSIMGLPLFVRCIKRRKENKKKCISDTSRLDDHIGNLEKSLCTIPKDIDETQTTATSSLGIDDEERSATSSRMACSIGDTSLGADVLHRSLLFVRTIVKFDYELKRILGLVIPFSSSGIIYNASNIAILAIISHSLGTEDMVAYAMVGSIIGVSSSFLGGWVEAISSLGSMAYGAGNYKLTGRYVQISCVFYTLCEIPMGFLWFQYMGKILLLMGFDESVAMIGQNYVWVAMLITIVSTLNSGVMKFLEVIEKPVYANFMYCSSCVLCVALVAPFAIMMHASLEGLGLVMLLNEALLLTLNVLIPAKRGWLREFEDGLFRGWSFQSLSLIWAISKVALPLAFGNLLAYTEWEILTISAAILGPAEAATWAVLGYVWGLFESTTGAIGSASELRVAYHLGKGDHDMAKFSAYKSILLAAIVTGSASAALMGLADLLPPLLTPDATIQSMLVELFPLVALGNVTMSMGMVCWAIVGAQGRYRLSTTIATSCAFFITIPIAVALTIMRIDLQGLTFAVVVGYTVTSMSLSLCVLMSDWKALAEKIKKEMEDLSMEDYSSMEDPAMEDSYSIMCLGSPPITTTATTAPNKPLINPPSRPGVFASYLDSRLLQKFTPVITYDVYQEVNNNMDDSSSYSSGLTTVCPGPPPIATPATTAPYTPPTKPFSSPGVFASYLEIPEYQLSPKLKPVSTHDVLGEVFHSVPLSPVLAAPPPLELSFPEEARVEFLPVYQNNYTAIASPLMVDTNPGIIEAASSATAGKSPAVALSMSPILSPESTEKVALHQKLDENKQLTIPDTPALATVPDSITFDVPALLVNKATLRDGSVLREMQRRHKLVATAAAASSALAAKLAAKPTLTTIKLSLPETAVENSVLTCESPDTPKIPALVIHTTTLPEPAAEPMPHDITHKYEDDVNRTCSENDNSCVGDAIVSSPSSVYKYPALIDKSSEAPSIPPLLFKTGTLPGIAAEAGPDDISMEHHNERKSIVAVHPKSRVCNSIPVLIDTLLELTVEPRTDDIAVERCVDPMSSVSNDGFIGDEITPSSSLIYENPVRNTVDGEYDSTLDST